MKKITIALVLMAAVCCSAQNLLKNADFQEVDKNGKLTAWKYKPAEYSLAKTEDPGDEGQFLSATVNLPEDETKNRTAVTLRQRIQLPEARKYKLTIVGKVKGTALIHCTWAVYDQDKKRIKIKKAWSKSIKGGKDAGWQTAESVVEVPEEAKTMTLSVTSSVSRKQKQEGGTVFIKEVSLVPAEE